MWELVPIIEVVGYGDRGDDRVVHGSVGDAAGKESGRALECPDSQSGCGGEALPAAVPGGDRRAVDLERYLAGGLGAGEHHVMPRAVVEPAARVDGGIRVTGARPYLPGGVKGDTEVIDYARNFGIQ
jgi:hypothetical protein